MNLRIFALLLAIMPGISDAAVRSEAARVGMQRAGGAGVRAPTMVKNLKKSDTKSTKTSKTSQPKKAEVVEEEYEEFTKKYGIGASAYKHHHGIPCRLGQRPYEGCHCRE